MSENKAEFLESPGSLRPSQVITTFGPGSIVQMADDSVLIMGLQAWKQDKDDKKRYKRLTHPFLEQLLNKDHFKMPRSLESSRVLPCRSFPTWGVCSNNACGRLQRHGDHPNLGKKQFYCEDCQNHGVQNRLFHARFIVMCDRGHIDEFPWIDWAHKDSKNECPKRQNPRLRFRARGKTAGLSDYVVICDDCGARADCGLATSRNGIQQILPVCSGYNPWLSEKCEQCEEQPYGVQTRATSVYYSSTISAIFVQKWLNKIQRRISEEGVKETIEKMLNSKFSSSEIAERMEFFDDIKKEKEWNVDLIAKEIDRRFEIKNRIGTRSSDQEVRDDEYKDIITTDEYSDPDLEIKSVPLDENLTKYLGKLKKIKRITEIRVLRGFTRGIAPDPYSPEDNQDVNYCRLSSTKLNWYPAVENKGEGIFFTLNEDKLREWEGRKIVDDRCGATIRGFEQWASSRKWTLQEKFSSRYILLHTLAHLLIRELSNSSGYNTASIRERIYRSKDYNGILIYTASPSSDGSLGGLVRKGDKNDFENLLQFSIEHSLRCSRDPLCGEDDPVLKESSGSPPITRINGSACYSCALLPETSCENSNRLLDRMLITDNKIGFFSGLSW